MIVITKMKIFSKDGVFRITFIILTFYILLKTILPCIEKISKINLFANTYFVYVLFVKILISTNPFKTKNKFLVFVSEIPLSKTHFSRERFLHLKMSLCYQSLQTQAIYYAKLSLSHKVFVKVFLTNKHFHLKKCLYVTSRLTDLRTRCIQ